ncbi:YkvA family protein [Zoogloea dura]|jgi:uncharacterized membrane protein YkvA (DUF1232 family)|uniref:DUF1232 domain-containing protein n=1 Tax=Zoogloea dura TaxID=2728840 RepID=A0A848G919_9RHOO|nr:DUF1232 domain-containing protein [Zoogloea dura]NML27820.1 DUF1232 domain-containing protein [Zoogloea dura]
MFKKLSALYALVRKDAAILWFALRHPARPAWLRPALAVLALYVLSPVDLVPDVLPVFGLIDDLVLVPLAMAWLVRLLPESLRRSQAEAARTVDAAAVRTR